MIYNSRGWLKMILDSEVQFHKIIWCNDEWLKYLGRSVFQCIVVYICTHNHPLCLYTSLRSYKVWTHTRLHLKE